jgi:hypothetical protein
LTEPSSARGRAIIVTVTTLRDGSDTTVILQSGDHPFIVKSSVIYFHGALIVGVKMSEEGVLRSRLHTSASVFAGSHCQNSAGTA